jgi:hypothetical protein
MIDAILNKDPAINLRTWFSEFFLILLFRHGMKMLRAYYTNEASQGVSGVDILA